MQQLDYNRIPQHVAIIMDGNGRWAKAKGLPRTAGHVEGVSTVKKVTEEAARHNVNITFHREFYDGESIESLCRSISYDLRIDYFIYNMEMYLYILLKLS